MPLTTASRNQVTLLFDSDRIPNVTEDLFDPVNTHPSAKIEHPGRGKAIKFVHQGVPLVLKRYHRGGYLRHVIRDSYAYLGLQRTRMWREFLLLAQLRQLGLPVPAPVAARCRRNTPVTYRGELISERLPDARTLVEVLEKNPLSDPTWTSIGKVIAHFHAKNVFHADLNAHNIMLDRAGGIFLIDFDKSAIRPRNQRRWAQANLQRLARSLHKEKRLSPQLHFTAENLQPLQRGYRATTLAPPTGAASTAES